MDETYRMLGREHEAELEREAARRRLARQLPRKRRIRRWLPATALVGLRELLGAPTARADEARRRQGVEVHR